MSKKKTITLLGYTLFACCVATATPIKNDLVHSQQNSYTNVAVGSTNSPSYNNPQFLAYNSQDFGMNWGLNTNFIMPKNQIFGHLISVSCSNANCVALAVVGSKIVDNMPHGFKPTSVIYTSDDFGKNWTLSKTLDIPQDQEIVTLIGLSCLQTNCVAVGYSAQLDANTDLNHFLPVAYRSKNSGHDWELASEFPLIPEQARTKLNSVSCGWNQCTVVGSYTVNGITKPLSYVGSNNAESWTFSTALSLPANGVTGELTTVKCNGQLCATGGSYFDTHSNQLPLAYMSTDTGKNWTIPVDMKLPDTKTIGAINSIDCYINSCIAVGFVSDDTFQSSPILYTSKSHGATWYLNSSLPSFPEKSIAGLNSVNCNLDHCVAVGSSQKNYSTQPLAYISNDIGLNWVQSSNILLPAGQGLGSLNGVH